MNLDNPLVIVTLISSILALIGVIFVGVLQLRGNVTTAADDMAGGFKELFAQYRQELDQVKKDLADEKANCKQRLDEFEKEIKREKGITDQIRNETSTKLEEQAAQIEGYKEEVREMTVGVKALITQLEANGLVPAWKPKSRPQSRPRD